MTEDEFMTMKLGNLLYNLLYKASARKCPEFVTVVMSI